MMESSTWRIMIFLTLLFSLYLFLVEWNQMYSSRHEIAYFQIMYKEKDYTSKHLSNPRLNIIDVPYYHFRHKANKVSFETDDAVWDLWWKEWNQTTTGFEMNGKNLCLSDEKKFVSCTQNESYNYACIDALNGAIEICGSSINELYLLPLCKEDASNKIITCGGKTHTNLCLPARSQRKKNFPIRPCTDKERHLCLIEDGSIDTCLKSYEQGDSTTDVNWNIFWKDWQPLKNEVTRGKSELKTVSLCINDQNKIVICEPHMSQFELCVGAFSGEVGICKEMDETNHVVPLCLTNSTKEIVTCGNFPVANLCLPTTENIGPLRPCMSKIRRTCLTDDGLLGHCSDVVRKLAVLSTPKPTATVEDTAEEWIAIENQQNGLIQLCKNDIDDKVHVCDENSSLFAACLSNGDGSIKACSEIESKAEFGIPVCVQEKSSNLVTCGKFSHSNLCMQHGAENIQLNHCKSPARFACVTSEGTLKFCSSLRKYNKKINLSNENLKYTLPMKYDAFELKMRSVTYLCKPNEGNFLVQCSDDANSKVVCLNLKDGKINSCKSMGYHNLSIPVCIMGSNKYIVTCGKFNVAPVCLSAKNESSKYISCVNTNNMACLNSGAVNSCDVDVIRSQGIKRRSKTTSETPNKMNAPKKSRGPYFRHKQKVYDAEMKILLSIIKDYDYLCVKEQEENKFSVCVEEPSTEFACLTTTDGTVKNCKALLATELGLPLCVKKSRAINTCGKFSKNPVCLYQVEGKTMFTDCLDDDTMRACLSEEGEIEPCGANEINEDDGDDNRKNEPEKDKYQRDQLKKIFLKIANESYVGNIKLCIKHKSSYKLINCDDDPYLDFACVGAVEGNVRKCSDYDSGFPISVCARVGSYHFVTCDIASNEHLCFSKVATSTYIFPCKTPDQRSCVRKDGYLGKCIEQKQSMEMKKTDFYHGGDDTITEDNFPTVGTSGPNDQADKSPMQMKNDLNKVEDSATDKTSPSFYEDITVGTRGPNYPMEDGENGGDSPSKVAKTDAGASSRDPESMTPPDDDSLKLPKSEDTQASESTDEKFYRIYCSNCSIDHKFVIVGTPDDVLPEVEVRTFPTEE